MREHRPDRMLTTMLDTAHLNAAEVTFIDEAVVDHEALRMALDQRFNRRGTRIVVVASAESLDRIRQVLPDLTRPKADGSPLTPRERQMLLAAADGPTVADIAARFCLSRGTVRNYLSTAMRKTGGRTRVEAARLAEERGWL